MLSIYEFKFCKNYISQWCLSSLGTSIIHCITKQKGENLNQIFFFKKVEKNISLNSRFGYVFYFFLWFSSFIIVSKQLQTRSANYTWPKKHQTTAPVVLFHFNPLVQIRGTVLACHAKVVFSTKQQNPLKSLDEILTDSNCTLHITNTWPWLWQQYTVVYTEKNGLTH